MATTVTYNGITLHNVVTRQFEQTPTYDQSGTDVIGQKYLMTFEGILHAQRVPLQDAVAYIGMPGSTAGIGAVYDFVKRLLSKPRGALVVNFGGNVALSASQADIQGDTVRGVGGLDPDIDNGPKPRRVAIVHVAGASLYRVQFEIECTLALCSPGQSNMVLNNRWRVSESMDANFFTTRRIDGRLRLAATTADASGDFRTGHAFKGLIVPPLENGFRRDRVDFTVEENGLDCVYTVQDKQVHTAAPWPATKMVARHSEATSDGVKFVSEVNVQLSGPPHVDKRLLIERAIQIADSRLDFIDQKSETDSSGEENPKMLIEFAQITDHIGEEAVVELLIRVQQLREAAEFLTHVREETIGTPLELEPLQNQGGDISGTEYDPRLSPYPALYGYKPHEGERRPAVLLLMQCYLQDLCHNQHAAFSLLDTLADLEDEEGKRKDPPTVNEIPPGSVPKEDQKRYSESARNALYTMSKITTQYVTQDMKVAVPYSKIFPARNQNSPTNVVLDLCEPQAFKKVDIDVERAGQLPELPEPFERIVDGTFVATRMSKSEHVYPPVLTSDGRYQVFRIEACYMYSLNRPPRGDELLRIGRHPNVQGVVTFVSPNALYKSSLV